MLLQQIYIFCFVSLYFYANRPLYTTNCTLLFSIHSKPLRQFQSVRLLRGLIIEKYSVENYPTVRLIQAALDGETFRLCPIFYYYKQYCSTDPGLLAAGRLCKCVRSTLSSSSWVKGCISLLAAITQHHQLGGEATEIYYFPAPEAGRPGSRCGQGRFLPRAGRENLFQASPMDSHGFAGNVWCTLAHHPSSALMFTWCSPSVCGCPSFPFS